jgi:hypothetical protein
MKDKEHKKKILRPLALTFPEQLQVHLRDLLEYILHLSERTQAFLYFFLQLVGDRDLAHLAIAETDRENPNRPVAFALALLAKSAPGFIAAHHAAQQGAGQDRGKVRHLLEELLAGGGKSSAFVFHFYKMKDITFRNIMQEKNDKTSRKCSRLSWPTLFRQNGSSWEPPFPPLAKMWNDTEASGPSAWS